MEINFLEDTINLHNQPIAKLIKKDSKKYFQTIKEIRDMEIFQ